MSSNEFPHGFKGPSRWFPPAIPGLGNLLSLASEPWKTLHKWTEKYGGDSVFHIGFTPYLLLGDPQSVADVLINERLAPGALDARGRGTKRLR